MTWLVRNLHRLVLALLAVVAGWRLYDNVQLMRAYQRQCAESRAAAESIARQASASAFVIPPQDPEKQSQDVLRTWHTLPRPEPLEWYMFYPSR